MTKPLFNLNYPSLSIRGTSDCFPIHRIYCVGQNYAAHTVEMGGDPKRDKPFFFSKPADAACQQQQLPWPTRTNNLHHEVELVVAINRGGMDLSVEQATNSIFGYGVGVDLTRRDLQAAAKQSGRPWDTAKGFDFSAPIGQLEKATNWQVDDEKIIALSVNGIVKQQSTLSHLIWKVPELIAELSTYYNLCQGDLVYTGTPAGVGALLAGDSVKASIDGLPELAFSLDNI